MMPRDVLGWALYGRENWESMQPGQVFSHTNDGYVDRVVERLADYGYAVKPVLPPLGQSEGEWEIEMRRG